MPRSRRSARRPYHAPHPELNVDLARGGFRVEDDGAAAWAVRQVTGDKPYRCPGCQQLIPPGMAHVVVWRRDAWAGEDAALADRRHWHASCWQRRARLR